MSRTHTADGRRLASMAHAKHRFFCSCGKIVHGNGGKTAHRAMHERKGDGHRYVRREWWLAETDAGRAWTARYEEQQRGIQATTDRMNAAAMSS